MTQTVYSEENMRVLLCYVIIPLIIILIIFFIGTKIYEHYNKKNKRYSEKQRAQIYHHNDNSGKGES